MPEMIEEPAEDIGAIDDKTEQTVKQPKISFLKIGIPVLLIQTVLSYFIASNLIVPRLYGDESVSPEKVPDVPENISEEIPPDEAFGFIYTIEDVIVNPAHSGGMQFVLINFGFEVKDEEDLENLKEREIQVRDILIKVLGAKTIHELDGPEDKEMLREEIKTALYQVIPQKHLLNVYFSNYIIQ